MLNKDFDDFICYLHQPVSSVCDSLEVLGYKVDREKLLVEERDFGSYSMRVTLVSDNGKVVDCIYLTYYPKEGDSTVTNEAIEQLVDHIGVYRELNNQSLCHFAMMTNSPDHAEQVLATTLEDALRQHDMLDADPSYDYNINYYWLGTDEKMETIEQLYDYIYRFPDTVQPNEAGITICSSLRNTEYPRQQLSVAFSCYY